MDYIRKNREETAMIYLTENERKVSQRLFCYMYAADNDIKVLDETMDIEEVNDCDTLLVATASVLTEDVNKYYNIERELRNKGIEIKAVLDDDNVGEYMDKALELFRKGRI